MSPGSTISAGDYRASVLPRRPANDNAARPSLAIAAEMADARARGLNALALEAMNVEINSFALLARAELLRAGFAAETIAAFAVYLAPALADALNDELTRAFSEAE